MELKMRTRISILFDGWQAGLIVIVFAIVALAIALPRPVLPDDIPYPVVDYAHLSSISTVESHRAASVEQHPPPYDVRALGEALRLYGEADASSDQQEGGRQLATIAQRVGPALQAGGEQVLRLRAYQMHVFLKELVRFEHTGQQSKDLVQVGGSFIAAARKNGWVTGDPEQPHLLPTRIILEALFKKRWNEITGLKEPPFALDLQEERVVYAFLFDHPIVNLPEIYSGIAHIRCNAANEYLLRKVGELGAIDKDYPMGYAQGVLLLRLGRSREAVAPLVRFLDAHPTGGYVQLAQNALREAQERVADRSD